MFVGSVFVGFFANCLFWGTCECLDVTIRCASKIHCQTYRFQPSTTLGGGVRKAKTVFVVSFGQKKLIPSSINAILWYYDTMTLWSHDITILWYYDTMILWYYDIVIWWYYDTMIVWYDDIIMLYAEMIWRYDNTISWYDMIW